MINKNIIGYELVKNVKACDGYERCGYDKLFVVRRDSTDYLEGLCEVRENTRENRAELEAKYDEENYIIWWGEIVTIQKGSARLPMGGDYIRFYWS